MAPGHTELLIDSKGGAFSASCVLRFPESVFSCVHKVRIYNFLSGHAVR